MKIYRWSIPVFLTLLLAVSAGCGNAPDDSVGNPKQAAAGPVEPPVDTMAPAAAHEQNRTNRKDSVEATSGTILFADPMTGKWQENWFVDGKKQIMRTGEDGLYVEAGPITKRQDPVEYHAHHTVLWTKQEFEGDIGIRYEFERVAGGGTSLLYIQAQGIGMEPYVEDISQWNELREIPAMNKYFDYMSLISVSFREEIRIKRYPWSDKKRDIKFETPVLFDPMLEYDRTPPGKRYLVDVEKRKESLKLRVVEKGNPDNVVEHTWDLTKNPKQQLPRLVEKGRIGLRNMGGNKVIYKHFQVRRL